MDGYLLVTDKTLDRVAEITKLPRSYWETEMIRFDGWDRHYVVFPDEKGQLVTTSFDKSYNVQYVMKQKFDLEPLGGAMEDDRRGSSL